MRPPSPPTSQRAAAAQVFREYYLPNVLPAALAYIRDLRAAGARVVLVTGSLDWLMEPVAAHFGADDVIATTLEEHAGRFTGQSSGKPIADEEKAIRHVLSYTHAHTYTIRIATFIAHL